MDLTHARVSHKSLQALERVYTTSNAETHRGGCAHTLGRRAVAELENARDAIAKVIHAKKQQIVFANCVQDILSLIVRALRLRPQDEIVIGAVDVNTAQPWISAAERYSLILRVVDVDSDTGTYKFESCVPMMGAKTRAIFLQKVSPMVGVENKIDNILRFAKGAGIVTGIDITYALGILPVDVHNFPCDFMVCGPENIGAHPASAFLYGTGPFLESLPPLLCGEDTMNMVSLEGYDLASSSAWGPVPNRFEAMSTTIASAASLAEAVSAVGEDSDATFRERNSVLAAYLHSCLSALPRLSIIGRRAVPLVPGLAFTVDGVDSAELARALAMRGIITQLTPEKIAHGKRNASLARQALRVAFNVREHTEEDVAQFADALRECIPLTKISDEVR